MLLLLRWSTEKGIIQHRIVGGKKKRNKQNKTKQNKKKEKTQNEETQNISLIMNIRVSSAVVDLRRLDKKERREDKGVHCGRGQGALRGHLT